MKRKYLLILIFAMVSAGLGFAQDFESMPKNTITVDLGPTFVGLSWSKMAVQMGAAGEISTTGFGIGAQYERQIMGQVSVGGRFAYMGLNMGMEDEYMGVKQTYTMGLSSFSIEGHIRYYTSADRAFFVDGMLGYANLAINFDGNYVYENEYGREGLAKVSFSVPRDYFKFGAKIGWGIDFGNPGGFIFEPSFGWYGGFGISDTLGKGLSKELTKITGEKADVSILEPMFMYLEDWIFVGGPRVSLSFGWRF